jgi:hypothetical protein
MRPPGRIGWTWLQPIGDLAARFEFMGYAIAALFVAVKVVAAVRRRAGVGGPPSGPLPADAGPSLPA